MSVMVLDPESLAAMGSFIADLFTHNNCNFYGPLFSSDLRANVYNGFPISCSREGIYKQLYLYNVIAYNKRYGIKEDVGYHNISCPYVDFEQCSIHRPARYNPATGKTQVEPWHAQMAGMIDCWLYNVDMPDSPMWQTMRDLKNTLYAFIVQNQPSYKWG